MAKYHTVHQYEPLCAPAAWGEEGRRFVNRLTEILDDIYRRYGRLGIRDVDAAFQGTIGDLKAGVAGAGRAVQAQGERLDEAERARQEDWQKHAADVARLDGELAGRVRADGVIRAVNESAEEETVRPQRIGFEGADIGGLHVANGRLYTDSGVEIDAGGGCVRVGGLTLRADADGGATLLGTAGLRLKLGAATERAANVYMDPESGELMRTAGGSDVQV